MKKFKIFAISLCIVSYAAGLLPLSLLKVSAQEEAEILPEEVFVDSTYTLPALDEEFLIEDESILPNQESKEELGQTEQVIENIDEELTDNSQDPELVPIEEIIPEITKIEFSQNSVDFSETLTTSGPAEIFYRYDLSIPDVEIRSEKAYLSDGTPIQNPFVLENYVNQPITVELTLDNNEKISASSSQISAIGGLLINEVYSYGKNNWIEIYNPSTENITLSNYKFFINQDSFTINSKLSTKIDSCGKLTELNNGQHCIVYIDYILSNSNFKITSNTLTIDELNTSEFGYYFSIIPLNGTWVETYIFTPAKDNVYKEDPEEKNKIMITEIYPAPDTSKGEYEWIEIYNYGIEEINLAGWYLSKEPIENLTKCKIKTGTEFKLVVLGPDAHTSSKSNGKGVIFNNIEDKIYLCNSDNLIIDSVVYNKVSRRKSYGKPYLSLINFYDFGTVNLSKLTPNDFNIEPEEIVVVDPAKSVITIAQARQKNENDIVTVKGSAIVEPNLLGDTNLYIQDSTGGIRIDLPTGLQINIIKDQTIQITGKVDLYYSEKEIDVANLNDIKFTDENNLNFQPIQINAGPIYSNLSVSEGSLVYTEGEIINNYSTSFDLQTSSGIIRVSILSSTGIDIPEKSKGDYVKVTGVLSRYNSDYRVLPRYKNDLEIISAIPPISAAKATKTTTAKPKTKATKTTATKTTATRLTTTAAKSVAIKSSTSPAEPGLNIISDTSILSATSQSQQVLFPFWILMLIGIITSLIILLLKVWKYYEIGQLVRKLQNKTNSSISKGKGYFEWR